MNDKEEVFTCVCKEQRRWHIHDNGITCTSCGRFYPVVDGSLGVQSFNSKRLMEIIRAEK